MATGTSTIMLHQEWKSVLSKTICKLKIMRVKIKVHLRPRPEVNHCTWRLNNETSHPADAKHCCEIGFNICGYLTIFVLTNADPSLKCWTQVYSDAPGTRLTGARGGSSEPNLLDENLLDSPYSTETESFVYWH